MSSMVRAIARLVVISLITAVVFALRLLTTPLRWVHRPANRAARDALMRIWAVLLSRAMGVRLQVFGIPPSTPCLLVSNHLGYLDIVLLLRCVRGVFVAKSELAQWPVVGPVLRSVGTIFVDRERKRDVLGANERIAQALAAGDGVVLFPEGTSSGGEAVLPLHPSLLSVAAERRHAVHFAALSYRTPTGEPPAADVVCWWGDHEFMPHLVRLLRLPYVDARLHFGHEPLIHGDRKVLAASLHEAISALHSAPLMAKRLT